MPQSEKLWCDNSMFDDEYLLSTRAENNRSDLVELTYTDMSTINY